CARQQQLKEKLDESDDLFDPTVDCDETNPFSLLPGVQERNDAAEERIRKAMKDRGIDPTVGM
ncbi:MAG: hypothetical protein AB7S36_16350, partial [Planctomycetota bacterium]